MIMQSAFFKLANIIPIEDAVKYLKDSVVANYGKKGQKIIDMNNAAIDKGIESIVKIDVPAVWADAKDEKVVEKEVPKFIKEILIPMNRQEGDSLPVSKFIGMEDGTFPAGTSQYEKRGIAVSAPEWQMDNCIQCNQCSYVCPHAVIRPFLITAKELENAPTGFNTVKTKGIKSEVEYNYRMSVSVYDCTGCGNCAEVCPAPNIPFRWTSGEHSQLVLLSMRREE